jgi:GntR family transcriptional repressor for pyruvate dehydrogenase complex
MGEALNTRRGSVVQQVDQLLRPIEKQTLTQTVVDRMLAFIQAGEIRPGQPLPSQHLLAEQLSVSRPILREAMQVLAAMGVVEIRPGSGCYVRDPHASTDLDSWIDIFTHDGAIEVLDARMVVEVELAGMAALRATEDELAEMLEILERLKRSVARGRATSHITSDFHQALARAGHNRPLYRMAQLMTQARLVQGLRVEHSLPDISAQEYESHKILFDAVASRDPDLARRLMREHLEVAHGWEERINALRSHAGDSGSQQ